MLDDDDDDKEVIPVLKYNAMKMGQWK